MEWISLLLSIAELSGHAYALYSNFPLLPLQPLVPWPTSETCTWCQPLRINSPSCR
ncbi:MAG TPA: hypothetical protein VGM05_21065 [Planctomycetaceae bacterium]